LIPPHEIKFWKDFIEKYLAPLYEDKEEKKRISEGLKDLRNQMVMSFLILNSIWVVTIFLFQQNKDTLFIKWPYGAKGPDLDWDRDTNGPVDQIIVDYEYLELEPLGVVFMVFFAVVMFIQLIGMILHRIMTLGHIVSSTHFRKSKNAAEFVNEHGQDIIREIQKNRQGEETNSMENAIEQTLQSINDGNPDELRKLSRSRTIKSRGKNQEPGVLSELKKRHSQYGTRKATMKRRPNRAGNNHSVITEEDEDEEEKMKVRRTMSKMDPNGFTERDA